MKIDLENMVFIFKGVESKTKGIIPSQLVSPDKIVFHSGKIRCKLIPKIGKPYKVSYGFDKFIVCDKNDAAFILYGNNNE